MEQPLFAERIEGFREPFLSGDVDCPECERRMVFNAPVPLACISDALYRCFDCDITLRMGDLQGAEL